MTTLDASFDVSTERAIFRVFRYTSAHRYPDDPLHVRPKAVQAVLVDTNPKASAPVFSCSCLQVPYWQAIASYVPNPVDHWEASLRLDQI